MAILSSAQTLYSSAQQLPSLPSYPSSLFGFPAISTLTSPAASSISFRSKKPLKDQRPLIVTRRASSSLSGSDSTETIGEILGDVRVFTAAGEPVFFKDLWDKKEGLAVVALLRHFGCPCCWEFASALKESKPRFDSAGVKLIAVGVGEPNKARMLAERVYLKLASNVIIPLEMKISKKLPFPMDCLYADPDRKAYDVLGLYYGFGRTFFNPASAKVLSRSRFNSLREAVKNYTIEATPDDRSSVLQQGGMFVFKGNQLLYSRKDEGTGDHAPLGEILDICCATPIA